MDDRQFDRLTHLLAGSETRRRTLSTLAGTTLGVALSRVGFTDTSAKRKKKKNRCLSSDNACQADGSGNPCCSGLCCPPWVYVGQTKYACAPADEVSGCCTEAQGGGYCAGFPLCCGNPQRERETICAPAGAECCTDAFGGSCDPGFFCCNNPGPGYCCPKTAKSDTDAGADGVERGASVPRQFRRRDDLMKSRGLVL